MEKITICYLSWKRNAIFEQTLKSHQKNGLFDLIPNKLIFFQEISEQDKQLAKKYNCKYIGNEKNIGILCAFIELIKNCKTDHFIFCENDWNLIESKEITNGILEDALKLSENDIIVKLRHRKNPGEPLYSKPKDIDEWLKHDQSNFPYKLESLSWVNFNFYPNLQLNEVSLNYKWYITTLEHQRWSNNVFMCKKNENFKLLENYKNTDLYLGLEDVLINQLKLNIKIAGGEGLFTHLDKIVN